VTLYILACRTKKYNKGMNRLLVQRLLVFMNTAVTTKMKYMVKITISHSAIISVRATGTNTVK
jgi:hypothetical protein